MKRFSKYLLVVALALWTPASSVLAQHNAIDFSVAGKDYPFTDLPGVVTTEEDEASKRIDCVQKIAPPATSRWRERSRLIYSCKQGNLTYESERAPLSREREMRGIGW